jgi:TRAP transporter 4TM/12TM fusion protein
MNRKKAALKKKDQINGSKSDTAADMEVVVEAGPREPSDRITSFIMMGLFISWSLFQLFYAQSPFGFQFSIAGLHINFSLDSFRARAWHMAFAIALAFLAYPAFKESKPAFWVRWFHALFSKREKRYSVREFVPLYDWMLAAFGAGLSLYIWWNYDDIIMRGGIPLDYEIWLGFAMVAVLLEAARRCLGPALPAIAALFLAYNMLGSIMPEFLRHRSDNLLLVISSQYISTGGIFGVPLKVSTEFVFLFVLFGALLERAGAGKYFIDVAYALMGGFTGGPAKASVMASGMNGLISGSSIANTVTTGTFTIPLMKKIGLPSHKAGAVEVAASTNGQLMPPIMGAAAFIMAETLGILYIDVVRAAFIPAVVSYIALFFVVHLECKKLGLKRVHRSELPPLFKTFISGFHYLIPVLLLIFFLVVLRRSAITSCMLALEAIIVIMLIQRPLAAWLSIGRARRLGVLTGEEDLFQTLKSAFQEGLKDIWLSLINGARNMVTVGVATATAGIIVGVVASTGLAGRFITVVETLSMGNIYLALIMTAACGLFLGMGLPTTANYIMMASLTAPVIIQLGADTGLVFPVLAAHLFVFYFGILADDTPPVGLAAYAAAAIAKADPIKTGIQGFIYDLRTAILPFVFLFNIEMLTIGGVDANGMPVWIDSWVKICWIFCVSVVAMCSFAAALQKYFVDDCTLLEQVALLVVCLICFRPSVMLGFAPFLSREMVQFLGVAVYAGLFLLQHRRLRIRNSIESHLTQDQLHGL